MIACAREVGYQTLCRIELKSAHSDDALSSQAVSFLDARDRNLVTEIVYGTLRWRGWLDYILQSSVSRPWDSLDPGLAILLRMSLYQMSRMDRVPAHAAVNDAVELAKKKLNTGSAGFVNGVLRSLLRKRPWSDPVFHRDCPMWARASLPRWLWERWEGRFGTDRAFEYSVSLNRPPQVAIRGTSRGLPRMNPPLDHSTLIPSELVPGAFLARAGEHWSQDAKPHAMDEASQLIPHLLGKIDGARIWDACAAPGGKSVILHDKCGPSGLVVSSDLDPARVRLLSERLDSFGLGRTDVLVANARCPFPFRIGFDAVLADVPCSGLGTLRRNPEIKWRVQPEHLREQSLRQRQIIDCVAGAVRIGGMLLYSTCSTEPEENELVVVGFLDAHPEFRLQRPAYPPGIEPWLDLTGLFRSFPDERLWDGFFAALMLRTA
jgi:16S rRNA (cytosine967-C5)-methyltransferase